MNYLWHQDLNFEERIKNRINKWSKSKSTLNLCLGYVVSTNIIFSVREEKTVCYTFVELRNSVHIIMLRLCNFKMIKICFIFRPVVSLQVPAMDFRRKNQIPLS